MENITETEKAYLAGLIDGEGYIGMTKTIIKHKSRPKGHPAIRHHLIIASTNQQVINWLVIKFGGKTASHVLNQRVKPIMRWWLNRQDLQLDLLKNTLPYMIIKREQARLMIEWLEIRLENRSLCCKKDYFLTKNDWDYVAKFKILNHRGM